MRGNKKFCPRCGFQNNPGDSYCLKCGYSFARKRKGWSLKTLIIWIVIAIILWFVAGIFFNLPFTPQKAIEIIQNLTSSK